MSVNRVFKPLHTDLGGGEGGDVCEGSGGKVLRGEAEGAGGC